MNAARLPRTARLPISILAFTLLAAAKGAVRADNFANAAGAPGLTMPAGRTADGLPIGVHLSAPVGGERLLLELGLALEAQP